MAARRPIAASLPTRLPERSSPHHPPAFCFLLPIFFPCHPPAFLQVGRFLPLCAARQMQGKQVLAQHLRNHCGQTPSSAECLPATRILSGRTRGVEKRKRWERKQKGKLVNNEGCRRRMRETVLAEDSTVCEQVCENRA